uniref:Uncharacterized protein n=1 Tax=Psilocybe cubensis TaxID=181762 RepID=A0A8H7XX24_PSICU
MMWPPTPSLYFLELLILLALTLGQCIQPISATAILHFRKSNGIINVNPGPLDSLIPPGLLANTNNADGTTSSVLDRGSTLEPLIGNIRTENLGGVLSSALAPGAVSRTNPLIEVHVHVDKNEDEDSSSNSIDSEDVYVYVNLHVIDDEEEIVHVYVKVDEGDNNNNDDRLPSKDGSGEYEETQVNVYIHLDADDNDDDDHDGNVIQVHVHKNS